MFLDKTAESTTRTRVECKVYV